MKGNAELKRVVSAVVLGVFTISLAACAGISTAPVNEDYRPDTLAWEDQAEDRLDPTAETADSLAADSLAADSLAAEQLQSASSSGPRMTGMRIESSEMGGNRLVVEMEAAGFYTFTKTAPSEYVLTLEGAVIDAAANQPILLPRGTGQIRSARPVVQGNDVVVRIFSEADAFLSARARGSQIVVASFNETAAQGTDIMAQAELNEDFGFEAGMTGEIAVEDDLADLLGVPTYTGRLISLDLQDTDIDNALRIIAEVSNLNIIASSDVTGKVTLRLIDVPWDQALDVILKTNGLDKVQEGNVVRIAPVDRLRKEREALRLARQAERELESLRVQYIRVSYAKASELRPLVETVLSERGTVAYDERTNQLIVKDITAGLRNVTRLVQKLDLRTPQVLIETQIVEAERTFTRDLGSELGFFYLRSPQTGNALPYNFPNSLGIGGSALSGEDTTTNVSSFPGIDQRSAIDMVLGSADGTKGLRVRLTQGEKEGRARVISRPSVAVTNNAPATIKAVTKLRIKLPSGGTNVATGAGAAAQGTSVATETIEVGIILEVTAQASPDYYVLMDIDAKSSTLGGPAIVGVDGIPPEVERRATSSVLVSSGQTFALGGIYQINERESIDGVPWLKDAPVFGHFFRSSAVSDTDQELIFFITPRIIEGSFDDAAMRTAS